MDFGYRVVSLNTEQNLCLQLDPFEMNAKTYHQKCFVFGMTNALGN